MHFDHNTRERRQPSRPPPDTTIKAALLKAAGRLWRSKHAATHPLTRRFFEAPLPSNSHAFHPGQPRKDRP
jgi:hypothetical protein